MYDVPLGPLEWDYACKFGEGIKAHLRQLTTEEEDSCIVFQEKAAMLNKSLYVRFGCVSLSGLSVGGKTIENGGDICDSPGLYALLMELFVEIQKGSSLGEDEVKN